jgi:large subunit ribosomal protein L4
MELNVINEQGASTSKVNAADTLFARDYNESLVHQLVVAYQANARLGNRKQLGRSEVAKSKKKPWRQKGTGRARSGKASSPLWRGGGRIFANTPDENFTQKVNRKMYRAGMASIFSQLARENRLQVIDEFKVDTPKTKLLAQKLKGMGFDEVLVITDELDDNLLLSSRNLINVLVLNVNETNPVSLVRFKNVLLTRKAVSKFEEMWA